MISPLSVDEYSLLYFFETLPAQSDTNEPWIYNDSSYEVTRSDCRMIFAIAPAYKDVRVLLHVGANVVYDFSAMGIDDVKHHKDKGRESLEIVISARQSLWIRTKPEISITESIGEAT